MTFDYGARADLFVARGAFSRRKPLEYKSFPSAGDAIRYAIEELSPDRLGGICLETNEKRFDGEILFKRTPTSNGNGMSGQLALRQWKEDCYYRGPPKMKELKTLYEGEYDSESRHTLSQ